MLYRVFHKSLIKSVLLYVVVIVTMTTIDQYKSAIRSVVIVLQLNVMVIARMTTGHCNNNHNTDHKPGHYYDDHRSL